MAGLTALVIVFVVVVVTSAIAFSVYTILYPVQTAADRLEALTAAADTGEVQVDILGSTEATVWEQIAERLGRLAQQQGEEMDKDAEEQRKLLKVAGFKNRRALDVFNGVRVAAAMLLPVAVSPTAFFMEIQASAFAMVLSMAFGYYGPLVYLHNAAQNRQSEILKSFPDALDLLVSSVESGLSLDQAFKRVAVEMQTVAPLLAKEFTLVNNEIAAGVERLVAMKHLEERTGIDEVRSLVNMLAQSERFGSSIADSLRVYSHVAREKRMSRAEEKAGAVGSKLTVIMIVFFLPVLMMILLAPSVIRMMFEG